MKKLLLASSALVLSAGMASAQGISLGGFGYMGAATGSGFGQVDGNNAFFYGGRLTASGRLQADHGLTFGFDWRLTTHDCASGLGVDVNDNSLACNTTNVPEFFSAMVAVDGFQLTVGNTNGAARSAGAGQRLYYGFTRGSLFFLEGTPGADFHSDNNQVAVASYTFGDLMGAVSYDIDNADWELGARGSFDQFTVGVGYNNGSGEWAVRGAWSDGVFGLSAGFSTSNNDIILQATYQMGEIGLAAATDLTDFALNATYDLGGGATASATLSTQEIGAGVLFNF